MNTKSQAMLIKLKIDTQCVHDAALGMKAESFKSTQTISGFQINNRQDVKTSCLYIISDIKTCIFTISLIQGSDCS